MKLSDRRISKLLTLRTVLDAEAPNGAARGRPRKNREEKKTRYEPGLLRDLDGLAEQCSMSFSDLVNVIAFDWIGRERSSTSIDEETVRRVLLAALRELTDAGTWLRGSPRELLADLEMDEVTALELVDRTVARLGQSTTEKGE